MVNRFPGLSGSPRDRQSRFRRRNGTGNLLASILTEIDLADELDGGPVSQGESGQLGGERQHSTGPGQLERTEKLRPQTAPVAVRQLDSGRTVRGETVLDQRVATGMARHVNDRFEPFAELDRLAGTAQNRAGNDRLRLFGRLDADWRADEDLLRCQHVAAHPAGRIPHFLDSLLVLHDEHVAVAEVTGY